MLYIMSDIHGQYDMYEAMMNKLNIKEDDVVYILGDVIDRGPNGIKILWDIMKRPNFELFLGNHEWFLLESWDGESNYHTAWMWENNGGMVTYTAFMHLTDEERDEIIHYLKRKTHLIKNLNVNGHKYVLSHTGVHLSGADIETSDLEGQYEAMRPLVWNEGKYSTHYLPSLPETEEPVILISGHICTRRITGKDEIYIEKYANGYTWIDIDCGCAYDDEHSRIGCLAIEEDGSITYILKYVDKKLNFV